MNVDKSECFELINELNAASLLIVKSGLTGVGDHYRIDSDESKKEYFKEVFGRLFEASYRVGFFWQYCPSKVYVNSFSHREKEYLARNPEFELSNFIEFEIQEIQAFWQHEMSFEEPNGNINVYQMNKFFYQFILYGDPNEKNEYKNFKIDLDFLPSNLFNNIEIAQIKKIEFLKEKLGLLVKVEDRHPRYFIKGGFEIFEKCKERIVRERYLLADFSFIYRQMQKDGYIYDDIKESAFRNWLKTIYGIEILEPLKTINECSPDHKFSIYSSIINSK